MEVKCHFSSHHIKGTCYEHDLSLFLSIIIAWLRKCLPGFSTVKLFFFHPFHTIFFERKLHHAAHTCVENLCFISLSVECLHKLLRIFYYGRFVYSFSFICSIIYISESWIFISYFGLLFNTSLFYCSNCSSFDHRNFFSWLLCPFNIDPFFLVLLSAPGLSCICLVSVLESTISPRSPSSFY